MTGLGIREMAKNVPIHFTKMDFDEGYKRGQQDGFRQGEALSSVVRCKFCKHWIPILSKEWGECKQISYRSRLSDEQLAAPFAQEKGSAFFRTMPNFGCVLGEEK